MLFLACAQVLAQGSSMDDLLKHESLQQYGVVPLPSLEALRPTAIGNQSDLTAANITYSILNSGNKPGIGKHLSTWVDVE